MFLEVIFFTKALCVLIFISYHWVFVKRVGSVDFFNKSDFECDFIFGTHSGTMSFA